MQRNKNSWKKDYFTILIGQGVNGKIKYTLWGCGQKLGPTNMVQEASPCILVKIE